MSGVFGVLMRQSGGSRRLNAITKLFCWNLSLVRYGARNGRESHLSRLREEEIGVGRDSVALAISLVTRGWRLIHVGIC